MNHTPLLRIYSALRLFHDQCNADELIGVRACLNLLRTCMPLNITFNLELRNRQLERENNRLLERIAKLELQCDDLREDNKVLSSRCKRLEEFDPTTSKVFKSQEEGYNFLQVDDGNGAKTKVWIQASKEEINKSYDELLSVLFTKKKNSDLEKRRVYMRNVIRNHYQHKGFKVK